MIVVNPEQVIATLEKGARFKARFFAKRGIGYVGAEENKIFCKDKSGNTIISRIAIDSIFTPIYKVRYDVEKPGLTRMSIMTNLPSKFGQTT